MLGVLYDATGLVGVRRKVGGGSWNHFHYIKDALSNIIAIALTGVQAGHMTTNQPRQNIICRYRYTAFGETTIHNPDGTPANFADNHIVTQNPFRWKSSYFDTETNWYYIDGRYYDPQICGYISAESPENLLLNAFIVHGLNRYAISTTNPLMLAIMLHTIFTTLPLSTDPAYVRQLNWWNRTLMWLNNAAPWLRWTIVGVGIVVFVVAAIVSKGTLIPPMIAAAMGGAMTGFVISGVMAGLTGSSAAEAFKAAAWGALTGASLAVTVAGVVGSVKFLKAKTVGVVKPAIATRGDGILIDNSLNLDAPSRMAGYTRHGIEQAILRKYSGGQVA